MNGRPSRARGAARAILIGSALFLPTLSLLPLGSLYLWQNGFLIYWAVASLVVVGLVTAIQWRLLQSSSLAAENPADDAPSAPNPVWSASEERAWRDVEMLARGIDIEKLTDFDAVFDLGHQTIRAVAHRLHPEKQDALWEFTVPEALAINERVSRRLGSFVYDNIPFGDRLTVAQVLAIYRWRSVADVAEKAYDVWRVLRLANPATALTHEARERMSRAAAQWGRAHVTRRLAETYVREVGRAAIDLYGGRLRITPLSVAESSEDAAPIALGGVPFRVLVTGGDEAERKRILDLIQRSEQRRLAALAAFLSGDETSATAARGVALDAFTHAAGAIPVCDADIVVWLISSADDTRVTADHLREGLKNCGNALPPEAVVAMVSGDQTLDAASGADLRSTRDMVADVFGKPPGAIVSLGATEENAQSQSLVAAIGSIARDAERVQLVRRIGRIKSQRSLLQSGRQAVSATGSLAKSLVAGVGRRLGL